MIITACDGKCGKQSPDDKGLYIANSWVSVVVRKKYNGREEPLVFCEDCWESSVRPALGLKK